MDRTPLFDFKTIKKLGQGGQGSVLLIQKLAPPPSNSSVLPVSPVSQQFYALKRIPCASLLELNQALLEVQSVLQIKHEHVVKCHHFYIEADQEEQGGALISRNKASIGMNGGSGGGIGVNYRLSILYEYCERGNLMNEIERARVMMTKQCSSSSSSGGGGGVGASSADGVKKDHLLLDRNLILKWMYQISKAVAHLHANSIVHRDLKPHNLFITATRDIKIGDFGFAKVLHESDFANSVLGSQCYLAPEIRSQIPYNQKVDCWGIGAIFLDLLLPRTCDFAYEFAVNQKSILSTVEQRYDDEMVQLVKQVVVHDLNERLDAQTIAELFEKAYFKSLQLSYHNNANGGGGGMGQDVMMAVTNHNGDHGNNSGCTSSSDGELAHDLSMNHNSYRHPSSQGNALDSLNSSEMRHMKEEISRLMLKCIELEKLNEEKSIDIFFYQRRMKEMEDEMSSSQEQATNGGSGSSGSSGSSGKSNSFKLFYSKKGASATNTVFMVPSKEMSNVQDADFFGAFFHLHTATWKSKEYGCEIPVLLKSPHSLAKGKYTMDQFRQIVKLDQLLELKHPRIERVFGVVELDKKYHVVSELLSSSLQKYLLNHNHQLHIDDKIRLALEIAEGLLYLHENGYVYTIMKTSVVCLDDKRRAKLTSLHFARKADSVNNGSFKAIEPRSKPPELITGKVKNPYHLEVYCFAFVMWEILYRKIPFEEVSSLKISDIATHHLRPTIDESVSSDPKKHEYIELMKMCWSTDPLARPSLRYIVYKLSQILEQ